MKSSLLVERRMHIPIKRDLYRTVSEARPFPGSWRMDVRGSQVCCPHRSCCTLMRCYSIVKFREVLYCHSLSSR